MTGLQLVASLSSSGQAGGTYTFIEHDALDQRTLERVVNLVVRVAKDAELSVKAAVLWAHEIVVYRDAEGVICGVHGFRYADVPGAETGYRLAYSPFSVVDDRFVDPTLHSGELGALLHKKLQSASRSVIWATVANHGRRHVVPSGFGVARSLVPSKDSHLPSTLRFYVDVGDGSDALSPAVEGAFEAMIEEQRTSLREAKARGLLLRPFWKRVGSGSAVALATAGALFLIVRPGHEASESAASLAANRTKGGAALHVYRQTASGSEETVSHGHFSPGDKLRFAVNLPEARRISIVGVQSNGERYVAWPPPGRTMADVVSAGSGQALEGAVSLDEATGTETLYLVSCAPDAAPPQCTSRGPTLSPECPPGCTASPFVLDKHSP